MMQEGRIIYDAIRKMLHVELKGLEHRILDCKVLILKYNLDMGFSEEML